MANKNFNVDDAEDFDDGTKAVTYGEELGSSDSENENARLSTSRKQRIQSKKVKQREQASSLRVKNWEAGALESEEYAGKVVKRKDIASEDEDDAMNSPDEAEMEEWSEAEPFGESDNEGDNSDDDENEEEIDDEESDDEDDEDKDAEKLIRGFEKEDSAQLMSSRDSAKLVEKAIHVRNQKVLWERCLEVQIYTKRLLSTTKTASAAEPQDDEEDEEANAQKKAQTIAQIYACIDAVSSLQDKLCNIPELTSSSASTNDASKKRKRSVDDLWKETQDANQAMLPQYNDILNTYTRKTNLAGGSQAKKFKAVNQDILAQVESVLADVQRVKRKAHAPLDVDNGNTSAEESSEDLLDELMYDDSDFYQQLLKEFIESGGGSGQDALQQRTHRKKKKLVNRKASKGRQLRYTVHPKLENFMFPDPYPKPEMDADELFRSLFGQVKQA